MRRLLIPALLLCLGSSAQAFINVEAVRMQATDPFVGRSSLKLNSQRGNTEKSSLALGTLNIRRWDRDELLGLADYNEGDSAGLRDTRNGQAHLRFTFLHQEALAYELFTQYQFDEFKDLISRTLVGANLRHRLYQSPQSQGFLGTGLFYEVEVLTGAEDRQDTRANFYFSHSQKWDTHLTGSVLLYYQPLLATSSDHRLRLVAGLEVLLNTSLSLDLDFELSHDSRPANEQVKKTDVRTFTGFSVKY